MSYIKIKNLTFSYGSNILFDNFSLNFDSTWKLGLISRNGRGKTTLLKLLSKQITDYKGEIFTSLSFNYCPIRVNEMNSIFQIIEDLGLIEWKVVKEANLLNLNIDDFNRSYDTFSGGEKVKLQLAFMFAKEGFVLLDEPTNYLDLNTKIIICNYLKNKNGFIITSHDRWLLDNVCDHIISINKNSIELINGNYSQWEENFNNRLKNELTENMKIEKEIKQLEIAKNKTKNWAYDAEKEKFTGSDNPSGLRPDRGALGKKAAKIMKRSKILEKRIDKNIEHKKELLNDLEKDNIMKLIPINYTDDKNLIECKNLTKKFDEKIIFENISFKLNSNQRLAIVGDNGSGKSCLLNILAKLDDDYKGFLYKKNNLIISYLPQNNELLKGSLKYFAGINNLDLSLLCTIIKQLGFKEINIDNKLDNLSDGGKRKILIASSLASSAEVYLWDEPLNFIDIPSKLKLENLILTYKPTLIFVEHDRNFIDKVATDILNLN